MSSIIPPKKKSKKRKIHHDDNVAAAYNEDLGTQGTKMSQLDDDKSSSILGLPLTHDEKNRRAKRMVRVNTMRHFPNRICLSTQPINLI